MFVWSRDAYFILIWVLVSGGQDICDPEPHFVFDPGIYHPFDLNLEYHHCHNRYSLHYCDCCYLYRVHGPGRVATR